MTNAISPLTGGGMGFVYPLFGFGGFGPFAGDLPGSDVEAVPDIGHRDVEDHGNELRFAVMMLRFVPDFIGNGIAAITESRYRLSERQGGAFGDRKSVVSGKSV